MTHTHHVTTFWLFSWKLWTHNFGFTKRSVCCVLGFLVFFLGSSTPSAHTFFFSCAQLVSVCCPGSGRHRHSSCLAQAQDEALCIVRLPKKFTPISRHVICHTFDEKHTFTWHLHSFLSNDTTYLNFLLPSFLARLNAAQIHKKWGSAIWPNPPPVPAAGGSALWVAVAMFPRLGPSFSRSLFLYVRDHSTALPQCTLVFVYTVRLPWRRTEACLDRETSALEDVQLSWVLDLTLFRRSHFFLTPRGGGFVAALAAHIGARFGSHWPMWLLARLRVNKIAHHVERQNRSEGVSTHAINKSVLCMRLRKGTCFCRARSSFFFCLLSSSLHR